MTRGPNIDFVIPEQLNLTTYYLEENVTAGRGDKVAVYYLDEKYTFNDMCALTNRVGHVLKDLGSDSRTGFYWSCRIRPSGSPAGMRP